MEFKEPEDVEKGPVWKGESEGEETTNTVESDGESGEGSYSGSADSTTVEFGKTADGDGMEMEVGEAVELASEMLNQPEAFGIASLNRVKELEKENSELRETVKQQNEAIADLAQAVESLSQYQGKTISQIGGREMLATVQLDNTAFGEIYEAETYDNRS